MYTVKHQPTKKQVMTDDLLHKGHVHKQSPGEPEVCPYCNGFGWIATKDKIVEDCLFCETTGEVWK